MYYVMDACDSVQSIILLPHMVGTSFLLVALTRLNVSELKHWVTWSQRWGVMCLHYAKNLAESSWSFEDYQISWAFKRRILIKPSFELQFGHCPLIWVFHVRGVNNKISHLHERSLRIVYKENKNSFKELLEKGNSLTH